MVKVERIKAERPAYGGISIGRIGGMVVMITGAIPGETVRIRIDGRKKDYMTGTAVSIIEPSPDRVEPACPYFGECGGCQMQYASYTCQTAMKQEVLADCLRRMARLEAELSAPLTGEPWAYRRRAQFKVSGGAVGFFRERSRWTVDIESCPLMVPDINVALHAVRGIVGRAAISEIHISSGDRTVALIIPERGAVSDWKKLVGSLIGAGIAGVCVTDGNKKPLIFGDEFMTLSLDGLSYTVSPTSFFQANWELNQRLVRLVCEELGTLEGMTVLDLYSGAGNFTLPLARLAGQVTAVEENPSAVRDGKRNAELNGISNVRFLRSDAESLDRNLKIDVLVTDPPRTGLTGKAADKVLAMCPERIAYISCNPATLARDLKKLCTAYELDSVRLVDFFPQTYHIEAVAFLRLK